MESLFSLNVNVAFNLNCDDNGAYDEQQLEDIKCRIYDALSEIGDVYIDDELHFE